LGPASSIHAIICSLSSSNESKVYSSLVHLRTKYTQEKSNVQILHNCGGIKSLLTLVSRTIDEAKTSSLSNYSIPDSDSTVGEVSSNASTSWSSNGKATPGTSDVQKAAVGCNKLREGKREPNVGTIKNPILVLAAANQQPCPECLQKQLREGVSIAEGLPTEECSHGIPEIMAFNRIQKKLLDLCLSILGNCVLLDERTRDVVS
jgi:hypothetical protein